MESIDILVPVYNCEKYIEKCLNSIASQTYSSIRVVIVDDGSTDKSAKLIQNYIKNHSDFEFFSKKNENNISKTRNFLLTKIMSNYFTFFDSDDFAEQTYIETLYNLAEKFNADISMCSKIRHSENKTVVPANGEEKIYFFSREEALEEMLSSNLYNGTVYAKLFKTSLLHDITFNENIYYGEDLDFSYKIMKNATRLVYTNKQLYHYIIRTGSFVTSKFNKNKLSCITCYENIIKDCAESSELSICAKSMEGLIAIELLYYTWRDKFKDKQVKRRLKQIIKNSIPYIRQNKRLSKLNQKAPLIYWITKLM